MAFENIDPEQIKKLLKYIDIELIEIFYNLSTTSPVLQSIFKFKDEIDLIKRLFVALSISYASSQKLMEDVNFSLKKFENIKLEN